MAFPIPDRWERDTAETARDEAKRRASPCSFFYAQGRALVLAASYFTDARLTVGARRGDATKHRHRHQLALFGQLMASFEYMLKDFVAAAVDRTDLLDDRLRHAKWLELSVDRILGQRVAQSSVGALLVHPTGSWHDAEKVNDRYSGLFQYAPITQAETQTLASLWILRHSVAHNAGLVTGPDASRLGAPQLAERLIATTSDFIEETFGFLCPIAERIATKCGGNLLREWLRSLQPAGPSFVRDRARYLPLKGLTTWVPSRPTDLPEVDEADYTADWAAAATP